MFHTQYPSRPIHVFFPKGHHGFLRVQWENGTRMAGHVFNGRIKDVQSMSHILNVACGMTIYDIDTGPV